MHDISENKFSVTLQKDKNLNDLFKSQELEDLNVKNIRNQTNRLEELFVKLTSKKMNNLQALKTLSYANVRRILRIWIQTIVPPAITTALYFLIFGALIGRRIGEMPGYEGLSYIEFMVPGLIMLSVITNSYANVASAFFGTKFQKSIEEILVSPMPSWAILCGFLVGGIARGLLVGLVVVATSLFFVQITIDNLSLTLISIVLTSLLFSLLGLLNGIYAKSFDDVSIVPTFVLTPLIYLGGIFIQ